MRHNDRIARPIRTPVDFAPPSEKLRATWEAPPLLEPPSIPDEPADLPKLSAPLAAATELLERGKEPDFRVYGTDGVYAAGAELASLFEREDWSSEQLRHGRLADLVNRDPQPRQPSQGAAKEPQGYRELSLPTFDSTPGGHCG